MGRPAALTLSAPPLVWSCPSFHPPSPHLSPPRPRRCTTQACSLLPWGLCTCGPLSGRLSPSLCLGELFSPHASSDAFSNFLGSTTAPVPHLFSSAYSTQHDLLSFPGFTDIINMLLFRCSVAPKFLRPHGLQNARLPCSSLSLGACSDSCSLSWGRHPSVSSSLAPFSSVQCKSPPLPPTA